MALVLFALQFGHNPPYREFCEARKVLPNAVTHWAQIPAIPTVAFKDLELTCLSPRERTAVFHSSGTTDQRPGRHFHSAESLAVYDASLWPWFAEHVLGDWPVPIVDSRSPIANRTAPIANRQSPIVNWHLSILTPPPAQAPHSSLVHMFETVRIAAFGRPCRRQENALVHGEVRQWRLGAEGPWDPLSGDRAAADGRRHRGRRRRRSRSASSTRCRSTPSRRASPPRRYDATAASPSPESEDGYEYSSRSASCHRDTSKLLGFHGCSSAATPD